MSARQCPYRQIAANLLFTALFAGSSAAIGSDLPIEPYYDLTKMQAANFADSDRLLLEHEERQRWCSLVITASTQFPRLVLNTGGPTAQVRAMAFSPDSTRLYTGGLDKVVQTWGFQSEARGIKRTAANRAILVQNLRWEIARGLRGTINTIAASPVSREIAFAGFGARDATGDIIVYDTAQATITRALRGHNRTIDALDYSPNGKRLASASVDGNVRLWTAPAWQGAEFLASAGAATPYRRLRFLTDDLLAVAVPVGDAKIWKIAVYDLSRPGANPTVLDQSHEGHVTSIVRDKAGKRWATADQGGNVFVWEGVNNPSPRLLRRGRKALCLDFGPEDQLFIANDLFKYDNGVTQAVLEMYNAANLQLIDEVATSKNSANLACAASPDGSRVVCYSGDRDEIDVYVLKDREGRALARPFTDGRVLSLRGRGERVWQVAFADGAGYQIGFGKLNDDKPGLNKINGAIEQVFDPVNGTLKRDIDPKLSWRSPFANAGGWTAEPYNSNQLLKLKRNGQDVCQIRLDATAQGPCRSYCWINDERGQPYAIAVGTGLQNGVFIYQLVNEGDCPLLRYFREHQAFVTSISVSADGKYLASGSIDQMVKIWSLEGIRPRTGVAGNFVKKTGWGANFVIQDGHVVMNASLAASVAAQKGIRIGDVIAAVEYSAGNQGVVKETDANRILDALQRIALTDTAVLTIDRQGKRLGERILLVPAWESLLTFFAARDGEWAAWSPRGYYDASVNGDELFGWQMNRAVDVRPDFYRADDFRQEFERPGVVRGLLAAGNLPDSLRNNNQPIPKNLDRIVDQQIEKTPVVKIVAPFDGQEIVGDTVEVVARVHYPDEATAQRVGGQAYVNGVPAKAENDRREGADRVYSWTLNTADVYNRARVVAEEIDPTRTVNFDDVFFRLRTEDGKPRRNPRLYTLAMAAADYKHVEPLAFPVADAQAILKVLKDKSGKFYDLGKSIELSNSQITRENFDKAVANLKSEMKDARADDLLIIFIAGHGLAIDGEYYFVTTDAKVKDIEKVAISWKLLRSLGALPCKKLLLMDTCHSGSVVPLATEGMKHLKAAVRPLKQNEILVFSATDVNQEAIEFESLGHGVFTQCILDGFAGQADAGKDGEVFLQELIRYVEDAVPERTKKFQIQTPKSSPQDLIDVIAVPLVESKPSE